MTQDQVLAALEAVAQRIGTARRLLAEGQMVDLAPVQAELESACQAVLELPRDEGRQLVALLEAMLDSLDRLEEDVEFCYARGMGRV